MTAMGARALRLQQACDRELDAALAEHLSAKRRVREQVEADGSARRLDVVLAVDVETVAYRERVRAIRRRYSRRARLLGWLPL